MVTFLNQSGKPDHPRNNLLEDSIAAVKVFFLDQFFGFCADKLSASVFSICCGRFSQLVIFGFRIFATLQSVYPVQVHVVCMVSVQQSVTCVVQSAMLPIFLELTFSHRFKFVWSTYYGYTNLVVIVFGFDKIYNGFFVCLGQYIYFFEVLQST